MDIILIVAGIVAAFCVSVIIALWSTGYISVSIGIKFKNFGRILSLSQIKNLAFDKKLISKGEPFVTDIFPADFFSGSGYSLDMMSDDVLLETAVLLAKEVDNPLANAIRRYADELIIEAEDELSDFTFNPNEGGQGNLNDVVYRGGKLDYIKQFVNIPVELSDRAAELYKAGKTVIYFSKGKKLLGIIAIADTIREGIDKTIEGLKQQKLHVVMLSKDSDPTANAIARMAGADEVRGISDIDTKEKILKELSHQGKTALLRNNGILFYNGRDGFNETAEGDVALSEVSGAVTAFMLSKAVCTILLVGVCIALVFAILSILLKSWMMGIIGIMILVANALRIFLIKEPGRLKSEQNNKN